MKLTAFITLAAALLVACAEEGESGTSPIDCGEHGTEHDGHCHCDDGYLFDGETCVTPEEVTAICGEQEGEHAACVCPDEGDCPCDDGEIVAYGDHDYCVPDPHAE